MSIKFIKILELLERLKNGTKKEEATRSTQSSGETKIDDAIDDGETEGDDEETDGDAENVIKVRKKIKRKK